VSIAGTLAHDLWELLRILWRELTALFQTPWKWRLVADYTGAPEFPATLLTRIRELAEHDVDAQHFADSLDVIQAIHDRYRSRMPTTMPPLRSRRSSGCCYRCSTRGSHDPVRDRYAGAIAISIGGTAKDPTVSLRGVGFTEPRGQDPNGKPSGDQTTVAVLTAEWPRTFFLVPTGAGALIGLHRTANIPAIRDALPNGGLDAILFPEDPVGNSAQLIAALATMFPAAPAEADKLVPAGPARVGPGIDLGRRHFPRDNRTPAPWAAARGLACHRLPLGRRTDRRGSHRATVPVRSRARHRRPANCARYGSRAPITTGEAQPRAVRWQINCFRRSQRSVPIARRSATPALDLDGVHGAL
jgi:uncharacterized protein DUF6603